MYLINEMLRKSGRILLPRKKKRQTTQAQRTPRQNKKKALILEKRVSRKDAATQRKKEKFLSRLNKQFEFQFIADEAGNSLRRRVFARVFSP